MQTPVNSTNLNVMCLVFPFKWNVNVDYVTENQMASRVKFNPSCMSVLFSLPDCGAPWIFVFYYWISAHPGHCEDDLSAMSRDSEILATTYVECCADPLPVDYILTLDPITAHPGCCKDDSNAWGKHTEIMAYNSVDCCAAPFLYNYLSMY